MELVGLEKSRLNDATISAIEHLELAPELAEIEDWDELFFKKGSCWAEKGSMLFDKRTNTIFKILLVCLHSQQRNDLLSLLSFNSKDRFRETGYPQ